MRFHPACSLVVAAVVLSCASDRPPVPQGATSLRPDIHVQAIAPGVWRHVSYRRFPQLGYFPSNGLVVTSPKGVLMIDTAWDSGQTARILDCVEANLGTIDALVVTHAHDDRLGGLAEVHRWRIPSIPLVCAAGRELESGHCPTVSDLHSYRLGVSCFSMRASSRLASSALELLLRSAKAMRTQPTPWRR